MKFKKTGLLFAAAMMLLALPMPINGAATKNIDISIDTAKDRESISPFIYGVNAILMKNNASFKAVRAGGNRYTGYNWETNASNAGYDLENASDAYFQHFSPLLMWTEPGNIALYLSQVCKKKDAYPIMTLGLAGYVAADTRGIVSKEQAAPSKRWIKTVLVKGSDYRTKPKLKDKTVYMDEFVYYLVNKLGDSQNGGIRGYSLDNEPSQWDRVHSTLHPSQATCQELLEKSITMASAVKAIDPNAEIYGPALYGYPAYATFRDAPDWDDVGQGYSWFIDYYLDQMKQAGDEAGMRLLDVLDIHYYTEAKGECGERSCSHYDNEGCVSSRLNATRTLWDESYRENSWIAGSEHLPLLPSLRESIDRYYPGTKIAISEYDFGAHDDISGAIAEADALGVFADQEVYFAALFAHEADYPLAAINLFTDFDGNGSGFGNTLVNCQSSDIGLCTAYAAVEEGNEDIVTLVVTNKSMTDDVVASIHLTDSFGYAHAYGINNTGAKIIDLGESDSSTVIVSGDTVTLSMKPESVTMLVIAKDKLSFNKYTRSDSNSISQAESQRAEQMISLAIKISVGILISGVVLVIALKIKSLF